MKPSPETMSGDLVEGVKDRDLGTNHSVFTEIHYEILLSPYHISLSTPTNIERQGLHSHTRQGHFFNIS